MEKTTKKKQETEKNKLLVLIRISGMIHVRSDIAETLNRLRLRKKYACALVIPTKEIAGMIEKVRHYISYGEIDKETLVKLLKARAQKIRNSESKVDKKEIDAEDIAEKVLSGKRLDDLGLKPFFRLHPPRGGIVSKKQCTRGGVLGPNKTINKLVERML